MEYSRARFGYASGEAESERSPELLLDGYFDLDNTFANIRTDRHFLVLGNKGTGKTSLGKHFELRSHNNSSNDSSIHIFLKDVPYKTLKQSASGDLDDIIKYRSGWKNYLWFIIFDLLQDDPALKKHPLLRVFSKRISKERISRGFTLASILKWLSKLKLRIPMNGYTSVEISLDDTSVPEISWQSIVDNIDGYLHTHPIKTMKNYYVFIDGLDEIVRTKDSRLQTYVALLNEVHSINQTLFRYGITFKFILLFRADIYELLPDANKNKLRIDYGINLIWYKEGRVEESPLVKLAILRGKVSADIENIFDQFFPRTIIIGSDEYPTLKHLLSHTRHTPRDFLQLLENLKQYAPRGNARFSGDDIEEAIKYYSINYFLPEIKDELAGLLPADDIQGIFDLFGQIQKRSFNFDELLSIAENNDSSIADRLQKILRVLYEHGAIGMAEFHRRRGHVTFKFRNSASTFIHTKNILLHRGLYKALNVQR